MEYDLLTTCPNFDEVFSTQIGHFVFDTSEIAKKITIPKTLSTITPTVVLSASSIHVNKYHNKIYGTFKVPLYLNTEGITIYAYRNLAIYSVDYGIQFTSLRTPDSNFNTKIEPLQLSESYLMSLIKSIIDFKIAESAHPKNFPFRSYEQYFRKPKFSDSYISYITSKYPYIKYDKSTREFLLKSKIKSKNEDLSSLMFYPEGCSKVRSLETILQTKPKNYIEELIRNRYEHYSKKIQESSDINLIKSYRQLHSILEHNAKEARYKLMRYLLYLKERNQPSGKYNINGIILKIKILEGYTQC